MDPLMRILLQAARWLRHPPPRSHAWLLLAVLAGALLIVAIERLIGWPEWARVEQGGRLVGRP